MACQPSAVDLEKHKAITDQMLSIFDELIGWAQGKEDPEFPHESLTKASKDLEKLREMFHEERGRLLQQSLAAAGQSISVPRPKAVGGA